MVLKRIVFSSLEQNEWRILEGWLAFVHTFLYNELFQVRDDVRRHQDHYSLLYVPYPFIIPGGRFREFYYW